MSKETLLEKFSEANRKLEEHIQQNKSIFDTHQKIVYSIIDAENELRDAVAESNSGVSNIDYTVTVTPQTQEVFNEEKILQVLRVSKEGAIAAGLIMVNKRPPHISIKKNA